MTPMHGRELGPAALATRAASAALEDAGIDASDVGLVVVGNALGGRLCEQGCIRGQVWLRDLGVNDAGVLNVDNSCASAASALHVGVNAAIAGESPVLVVGVEKMWTGDRTATMAGIEDALPADERSVLRAELKDVSQGSVFMGMNARWVQHQLKERGTTLREIAGTVVKARRMGALNELAQHRSEVTIDEVLASPLVAGPLTRLMCSSFTDGAAAAVLTADPAPNAPRVLASVLRSGIGELEYHERLERTADDAWKMSGVGPDELDLIELHDATSAEELYALESLGFFDPGEAGPATMTGATLPGGTAVCVNPSGGLVARGHPIGATGLCQIFELVQQLRGRAGSRQVEGARLGAAVNTGGIISGDIALSSVHVLAND
jgi:acetyl-CoA acetyltransferase